MFEVERTDSYLLFHAGPGEWYNQPHGERWDMGEDVADIPPAAWHGALEATVAAEVKPRSTVVVDVARMDWLVGQDWGFLLRLSSRVAERGARLAVLGTTRIVRAGKILGLDARFGLGDSLDGVLGT